MNLRQLVNGVTRSINPNVTAILRRSTGSVTRPSGERIPTYSDTPVELQVQALSYSDLRQLDGLNIQGTRRAIYVNGAIYGVIRAAQKGGDLIVFPNGLLPEGNIWLCVHVLEQWSDWCKIAVTLQE